jgi:hypothetical protein
VTSDSGAPQMNRWDRFKRSVKRQWDTPAAVVGGVVVGFSQVASDGWAWGLVIGGSALLLAGGVGAVVNGKKVAELEDGRAEALRERDALKDDLSDLAQVSKAVYRSLLSSVAKELCLGSQERITVYLHDADFPTFQLLSRHSPNPLLESAPRRAAYPDHYGLIGQAWRDGWAEERALPDPTVGGQQYLADNLAKYGLPTEVTENLEMKSRVLVGLRYPADPVGDKHIGVLIVESLDSAWDITDMRSRLEGSEMWYTLQEHLRAQRHRLPKLSVAEELGF